MSRTATTKPAPHDHQWGQGVDPANTQVPADGFVDVGYQPPNAIPDLRDFNHYLTQLDQLTRYYIQRGLPDWDAAETYSAGDVVRYGTRFFVALAPVVAANPLTNLNLSTREWEEKFFSDFGTPHTPADTTPIRRYRNAAAFRGNGIDRLGFLDGPTVQNWQENWRGDEGISASAILEKTNIRWNVTINNGSFAALTPGSSLLTRQGKLQITTGGSEECKLISEPLSMFDDGVDAAFEGSILTGSSVDQQRIAIGIANGSAADVYGSASSFVGAVMYKGNGDTNFQAVTGDGTTLGTPHDTGVAVVGATRYNYRVEWIGSSQADNATRVCNFYLGGTRVWTETAHMPNGGGSLPLSIVIAQKRDTGSSGRQLFALPFRFSARF